MAIINNHFNMNNNQNLRPNSTHFHEKYSEAHKINNLHQFYKFQNNSSDSNIIKGFRNITKEDSNSNIITK
jgi:hypothetical protein